jgi:hypothetical protein
MRDFLLKRLLAAGATFQSSDRGIAIFRLQPDGKCRIVRYIDYEIE